MPVELEIEDVAQSELTDGQRLYFDELDRSIAPLGFRPARTYTVGNLQGFNLVRSYLSEVGPEMVHAMLLRAEASFNATPTALNYLEVMTRYADGTGASTRNGDVSTVFVEPPHLDIAVRRTLHSPAELIAAHRKRSERIQGPRAALRIGGRPDHPASRAPRDLVTIPGGARGSPDRP